MGVHDLLSMTSKKYNVEAIGPRPIQLVCDVNFQDWKCVFAIVSMSLTLMISGDTILFKEGLCFGISRRYYLVRVKESDGYRVIVKQIEERACQAIWNDDMPEVLPKEVSDQFAQYLNENKILGIVGRMVMVNIPAVCNDRSTRDLFC